MQFGALHLSKIRSCISLNCTYQLYLIVIDSVSDVVTEVSGGYEPATSTSEEPIATRKVQDNVKMLRVGLKAERSR